MTTEKDTNTDALGAVRELVLMGFLPTALGGDDDGPELMLYIRGTLNFVDTVKVFGDNDGQTVASRLANGIQGPEIIGDIRSVVAKVKEWPTSAIALASDF
jgi:hypothetical protein